MSIWGNNYGIKGFVPPVDNARITSSEGYRKPFKTSNGNMSSSFHRGVDVVSNAGGKVPIKNSLNGTVMFAGTLGGYGKTIIVQNPDGYTMQYAHLDSISVKPGQQLKAGEQLGIMGTTGNSTGVHLDFIIAKDGKVLKRDGSAFGDAKPSMMKYAKTQQKPSQTTQTTNSVPISTQTSTPVTDVPVVEDTPVTTNKVQSPKVDDFFTAEKSGNISQDFFSIDTNERANRITQNAIQAAANAMFGGSLFKSTPIDYGVAELLDSVGQDEF